MKLIVALCLVLSFAAAAPPKYEYSPNDVRLLRFDFEDIGNGKYKYGYEQSDGTKQEQQGELENEGREDESLVVTGYFTWVGPDKVTYFVKYRADKNGYQPEIEEGPGGAISPAVLASLAG